MKTFQIEVTATIYFDIKAESREAAAFAADTMVQDGFPIWSDYDGDTPTTDPEFSFQDGSAAVHQGS